MQLKTKMANSVVKRSFVDRRSGEDKRKSYSLDYFVAGGTERRKGSERRQGNERRFSWLKVSQWYSVFIGDGV
jgi:hypothetical protein